MRSLNISTDYCAKPTLGAKWTLGAKTLAVTEEGTSWRMQCHCMAESSQRNMQEKKHSRPGIIWGKSHIVKHCGPGITSLF